MNNTIALTQFLNDNESDLLHVDPFSGLSSPRHIVPDGDLGARTPAIGDTIWNAPGINNNDARHQFAVMTCNGCHSSETDTDFTHVKVRPNLVEAALSNFLTGGTINDPVSGESRRFDDLSRREDDLLSILHSTRFELVRIDGLRKRVH